MTTQERIKYLFNYNSKTGIFTRLVDRGGKRAGSTAGYSHGGYISIQVDGVGYFAHRLAWLYVHGYFPENEIDHINRVKTDNSMSNLREVSLVCNRRNIGNRVDNTSGVKGVFWHKRDRRWRATIKISKKFVNIISSKDFEEAVCHRLAAEQCVDWSGCESNSPAFKYVTNIIQGDNP